MILLNLPRISIREKGCAQTELSPFLLPHDPTDSEFQIMKFVPYFFLFAITNPFFSLCIHMKCLRREQLAPSEVNKGSSEEGLFRETWISPYW